MEYSAIVLCAGSGTRSGLSYNKIFHVIAGETIYEKTMRVFLQDVDCKQIIVVGKQTELEAFEALVSNHKIEYVIGGKERQDSVYEGLQKVNSHNVMIHDGARPYVEQEQIKALKDCLQTNTACLLMVPCKDTIKEVIDGKVVRTIPRETLMQAQTPQAFTTKIIKQAYEMAKQAQYLGTDDASLVEQFTAETVYAVLGSYQNSKVTTKEDL